MKLYDEELHYIAKVGRGKRFYQRFPNKTLQGRTGRKEDHPVFANVEKRMVCGEMKIKIFHADHQIEIEKGLSLEEIAKIILEKDYRNALLTKCNGKVRELCYRPEVDSEVKFITYRDKIGHQTYENTALMVLFKAVRDLFGEDVDFKAEFSTGNGIYLHSESKVFDSDEKIGNISERMADIAQMNLNIEKLLISKNKAMDIFHRNRMPDKEKIFRYKRTSGVTIYKLLDTYDYFYGYMLPNTGYLTRFLLQKYEEGAVLVLPPRKDFHGEMTFKPSEKLFARLHQDTKWGEKLGLSDVGDLNRQIVDNKISDLVLMAEAMMEKKIGDIAEEIASHEGVKLVMIAGPSSSGKTTFSHRLSTQLRSHGLRPHPIAVDDYFVNREDTPKDENGNYDFECLEAINVEQFNEDMLNLMEGRPVHLPKFNFKTGKSELRNEALSLDEGDILVIEGIHCLNDDLSYRLPHESKFKIYISALTQLNLDDHSRIHTTDARLLRRMVRDARTRGTSAQNTIKMWASVRRGEDENIFPFQESADIVFNSALVYELAVIKPYAENLLFGIPNDCEEYLEAKRLLKFLDYFLTIPAENVIGNSIFREFIGGSYFHV